MSKVKELETRSAEEYRDKNGYYVFPFVTLDTTPGGNNLGRIEWHIEPIYGRKKEGRYWIEKLMVWPTQTYDKRYYKLPPFEIPCYSECLHASALRKNDSFLGRVWRAMYCDVHKGMIFSAYPDNRHTELIINVGSSIMIDAEFK